MSSPPPHTHWQAPCEGTGAVKQGALKHNAYLAGRFLGDVPVLARMQVRERGERDEEAGVPLGLRGSHLSPPHQVTADEGGAGCTLKIGVRASDPGVSELLVNAIA